MFWTCTAKRPTNALVRKSNYINVKVLGRIRGGRRKTIDVVKGVRKDMIVKEVNTDMTQEKVDRVT
jgi:hypothetical protein